jgi:hypothetical protein
VSEEAADKARIKVRAKLHATLEELLDDVQRPGWFGDVCLRFCVHDGRVMNARREPSRVEKF